MTTLLRILLVAACSLLWQSVADDVLADEPSAAQVVTEQQLVNQGLTWRRAVEADEKDLREAFEQLDQAIAQIAGDNLYGERLTILELRRVVKQMRQQAPKVVAAHRETLEATKSYGDSVREAAPLLLAAAKRFEEYAADELYDELREDYRLWGESFQAIAKKYRQQEAHVSPTIATVSENLAYVIRTEKQLARVERLLDIVPEEGVATEQFLTRLASYVESFALFRKRLRALHGRTVREDVTPSNQATSVPGVGADVAAEADLLPLARMVGVKPVSLRVDLQVRPTSARPADAQPRPRHPLVGRWDMGTGRERIPLEIYEQSGTLMLRLAEKHFAISEVEGVVVPTGNRHTVRDMLYAMRTGERLNLGDCTLRKRSDSELTVTCPMVRGNFTRGFRTTTEQKTSTLYRVE